MYEITRNCSELHEIAQNWSELRGIYEIAPARTSKPNLGWKLEFQVTLHL